ncbi:MAG: hypothetical protein ACTHV8_04110 [Nesterenkonia sp.]
MTTAIYDPETEYSPLASALDDIARFGPQFLHEQDIYGIDVAHALDAVTIRLNPGEAGNRSPCTAEFQIETIGDALRITVNERYGATGSHHPPMLILDADDQKHCGLLPWLRLWAAAWLDQARRS